MRFDPQLTYSTAEHRWFRIGIALSIVVAFFTRPITAEDQLFPKGIAQFLDLTFLANDAAAWTVMGLAMVVGFVFATGRFTIPCLTFLFAATVCVFTFAMSHQPKVRHDTNTIPLAILGLLLGHVHYAIVKKRGDPAARFGDRTADDLAVYYALQMIVAMYVLSGITKLIKTDGAWLADSYLVATQVVRTQHNMYFTRLTPEGGLESWLGVANFMVEHRNLTRCLFGAALVLEAFAWVALLGRGYALVIGLSLIVFHLSVFMLMNINFYLNVILLAVFLVNPPYWIRRCHGVRVERRIAA